jgi:hypothetical protein
MEHTCDKGEIEAPLGERERLAIEGPELGVGPYLAEPISRLFVETSRQLKLASGKCRRKYGTEVPTPAPKSRIRAIELPAAFTT